MVSGSSDQFIGPGVAPQAGPGEIISLVRAALHSRIGLTMDIYTQVPDKTTRDALKRLSDLFDLDQAAEPAAPTDESGRADRLGDDQEKPQ